MHSFPLFIEGIIYLFRWIDSNVLLKKYVSCNFMLKYYITVLLRQFKKSLNYFLNLPRANVNLEIRIPVSFEQLNESKQFWGISDNNVLLNGHYFKNI